MIVSMREAAHELLAIATEVRDVAARVEAPIGDRDAIARDLRITAFSIERQAAFAERRGRELGEPDPSAPRELVVPIGT